MCGGDGGDLQMSLKSLFGDIWEINAVLCALGWVPPSRGYNLVYILFCLTPRLYSPHKLEGASFFLWYYGVLTGPGVKLSSCITGQVIRWFSELAGMGSICSSWW